MTNEERLWHSATSKARRNIGFFWRELFWDNQRDEQEVEFAAVLFEYKEDNHGVVVTERVWLADMNCDGLNVTGTVLSEPQHLLQVQRGQQCTVPIKEIEDWMYVINRRVYGAYTINVQRSRMDPAQRRRHDIQWGYAFGDPLNIQRYPDIHAVEEEEVPEIDTDQDNEPSKFLGMTIAPQKNDGEPTKFFGMTIGGKEQEGDEQKKKRVGYKNLSDEQLEAINQRFDHPEAIINQEMFFTYYRNNPAILSQWDEQGLMPIHAHTLAGNRHIVRLLLELGVSPSMKTYDGRTSKDIAKVMNWVNIVSMLASAERGQLPPAEASH